MQSIEKWQQLFHPEATPLEKVESYFGVDISIKRDDLNNVIVQGNKLRKLKYNLQHAIINQYKSIATFGGAWSNHIVATAKAASLCHIKSIGFIRGDELKDRPSKWSKSLVQASDFGMQLVFLSRQEYKKKLNSESVKSFILNQAHSIFCIPEGGSNKLALRGVSEIIDEIAEQAKEPDLIITACGTGGTMAGIIDGIAQHKWKTKVIGICVLKGAEYLVNDVKNLSLNHYRVDWKLIHNYHAGGYAKLNSETEEFAKLFTKETDISLDKIYTGKSFYGAYDLIRLGKIHAKSQVVIVHTGGLQGGVII